MPNYTIAGRVVDTDGNPIASAAVTVYERFDLTTDNTKTSVTSDSNGRYTASWSEATTPAAPWDLFVEAVGTGGTATSALISELESTATVDLVIGTGTYEGRSEWARVQAKVDPLLGTTSVKDVPVDRLEWLARRADVFPTQVSAYIQAHRLADGRNIKAESCFAFLRAGLPSDMPGLLRSGEAAWEAALRRAWTLKILDVPGSGTQSELDMEVSRERDAMRELVVEAATTAPTSGVNQRSLLDTAGLSQADQETFTEDWLARTGDVPTFWSDLTTTLGATKVATLQFTLQAAALVSNDVSTLTGLQAERNATNISTVRDLAAWSSTDWDTFLVNQTVTVPAGISGADATERRQNYAAALNRATEDAYPTDYFRHTLIRDEGASNAPANTQHVSTFLTDNPDFDVIGSTVAVYLDGAVDPWKNTASGDQVAARANVARLQRLYRLTPRIERYETARVLLDDNLDSAAEIVRYTKEEFVAKYGPLLPAAPHEPYALAGKIWTNATQVHSATIGLASQFALTKTNADFVPVAMPGGEQFAGAGNGLAELETILGNLDYCACEHCRSVFSPAAYLADLLGFLKERPAKIEDNALDVLVQRRPDIAHILLDCDNTNTPLPYIDLVNEILEAELDGTLAGLAPGGASTDWNQTTWKQEELRIHPEHLSADVYDANPQSADQVTEMVYPWSLPFSLPTVEARVYLQHLGDARADVMRTFAKLSPTAAEARTLAGEALGLNSVEAEIVAGDYTGNTSSDDREFWGYADIPANDGWVNELNGTATDPDPNIDPGDIGKLLRRGGYTLDELREYLELDFINNNGSELQWAETCALADATISFFEADELDRLHRFTRLQRSSGISARMLNVLIVDVFASTLDANTLSDLADIVRLRARLGLEWDELATFWASVIDARTYADGARSLYERRVRARDTEVPDDFNVSGTQLQQEGVGNLSDSGRLEIVLAAIGASEAEFQALVQSSLAGDAFTFANLTALMRCVLLMRALKFDVGAFVTLADPTNGLTGIDPFASAAATADFLDAVEGVRGSGLTVDQLDWLLRDDGTPMLDAEAVGRELAELARGLATIEQETTDLTDPDGVALQTNLEAILDGEVAEMVAIVDGDSVESVAAQQQRISDKLGPYLDADEAKNLLVEDAGPDDPNYEYDITKRRAWLLGRIVSYQRRRALVVDTIAARFEVSATVAEALTFVIAPTAEIPNPTAVLTAPSTADALGTVFLEVFADEDAIAAGIDMTSHPEQFKGWIRAAKAAILANSFGMRADEIAWYSGQYTHWLDFDLLPIQSGDADASFDAWNRLRLALSLRIAFDPEALTHATITGAGTFTEAIQAFASYREWDAAAIETVATTLGYTQSSDFQDEGALLRLHALAQMGDPLGVGVDVISNWAHTEPDTTQATAIKTAARAKHSEARWMKLAAPMRDAIREQQRDALVDAVLNIKPELVDANGVFNHYLIDTQMSACMQTTRIKQAISAVQVFIHRALLRLEPDDVEFGQQAIARWEWMKNYRVWEANRKVFLYPENWIEPELRLDKTPEFESLEATLMQGVLDESRVEKALAGYLDQLDKVSRLEIVSVHEGSPVQDLWLLGRTAAEPYEWFVRQRTSRGAWMPWEAVPAKIDTDAVTMFVHQRRVHVLWVSIEESLENDEDYYQHRLMHVERTEDGWSRTTASDKSPKYRRYGQPDQRVQVWLRDDELWLAVANQYHWAGLGPLLYRSAFGLDVRDGDIRFLGSDFSPMSSFNDDSHLVDLGVVSLQNGYVVSGSRYVNPNFFGEAGDIVKDGVPLNSGTHFSQGSYRALLFGGISTGGETPALAHQADIWLDPSKPAFDSVVYDDRRRKYLLTPDAVYEAANSEGDDVSPALVGQLDVASYTDDCPPEVSLELAVASLTYARQPLRDGLEKPARWSGGVPGRFSGEDAVGVQAPEVGIVQFGADLLYGQVGEQAQAAVGAAGGYDNGTPASSTAFFLTIEPLYHPFSRAMVEMVSNQGVGGLYSANPASPLFRQAQTSDPFGSDELDLNMAVLRDPDNPPIESFDFRHASPYGPYNWELFYHVPMLVASKLAAEQRFDEAQAWHHRIFNPIDQVAEEGASRFWRLKPFVEEADLVAKDQLEVMLGIGVTPGQQAEAIKAFTDQVKVWENNPFDPHAIARIRPGVYQRALLRKYLDNLIAWADHLFRRDTMESINEAIVLYVLIAQLLGERPQEVPGDDATSKTFAELDNEGLDAFANTLVELEGYVHLPPSALAKAGCDPAVEDDWVRVPVLSRFWYFCYPPNNELLKYWDIVEDRLWKIRHCQNIEGVTRTLPIFQPPIDPGLLVRATAAGVDIQSVLAELDSELPPYRFRSVHARAMAFTGSLRALGSELLSALEKRDAEALSRIRSTQELDMLARVRTIRAQQIDEAERQLASLRAARAAAEDRSDHYATLIGSLDKDDRDAREKKHFDLAKQANQSRQVASTISAIGSFLAAIPQLSVQGPQYGGLHLANVMSGAASVQGMFSTEFDYQANKVQLRASYARRREDWQLQKNQADRDIDRIDQDILAAEIRLAIAQSELDNHDLQAQQSADVDLYMREKFTNRELYDWMIGQLSTVYFQTYQLAFDLAKRAERAYRHELAIDTSEAPIIKYGYWDSLRKGLLAGARLQHDLERLDLAYMDRDVREFELRKSISLADLDPAALRDLQEGTAQGGVSCTFTIPELLFDLDHPGHYVRRIKAVRVTIPAVVGPHTSLGARLELVDHHTRIDNDDLNYSHDDDLGTSRFAKGYGGGEAIATSTAVADGGLFNLDFRDERYLPFEYAGAVSTWKLTLPDGSRQFDYRTISDVVIHIDYTARDGGEDLRTAAEAAVSTSLTDGISDAAFGMLVAVHDAFPNEWEQFFADPGSTNPQVLNLPITPEHFGYLAERNGVEVDQITFALLLEEGMTAGDNLDTTCSLGASSAELVDQGAYLLGDTGVVNPVVDPATWTLTLSVAENATVGLGDLNDNGRLNRDAIAGLIAVVHYRVK